MSLLMSSRWRCFFILVFIAIINLPLRSQDYYVNLSSGPSFGFGSHTFLGFSENLEINSNGIKRTSQKMSFGNGTNITASFGFIINENISLELEFGSQIGRAINYRYQLIGVGPLPNTMIETEDREFVGSSNTISPSLVYSLPKGKFRPFIKFGPSFSRPKAVLNYRYESSQVSEWEYSFEGGLALGLNGSIGTYYNLHERIDVFLELRSVMMSYSPKRLVMKAYSVDGIDRLGSLSISEKETEFHNSFDISADEIANFNSDPNKPTQELSIKIPYSSFQTLVGIRFNLFKNGQ